MISCDVHSWEDCSILLAHLNADDHLTSAIFSLNSHQSNMGWLSFITSLQSLDNNLWLKHSLIPSVKSPVLTWMIASSIKTRVKRFSISNSSFFCFFFFFEGGEGVSFFKRGAPDSYKDQTSRRTNTTVTYSHGKYSAFTKHFYHWQQQKECVWKSNKTGREISS